MTFEKPGLDAFVAFGEDRAATARMLTDLADKHGISQSDIHVANDGFYMTEELADLIGSDDETTVGEVADDVAPGLVDPIEADRERIREAEAGAVFTQASAAATAANGEDALAEADARVAANEAEAAQAAEEKAAAAEQEPVEPEDEYIVADHTVDEVKEFVSDNPDQADAVLAAEKDGDDRVTLVKWLDEFIADRDDETVE